jgi:uncharacterized membrane protein YheB (UPF0754 family)
MAPVTALSTLPNHEVHQLQIQEKKRTISQANQEGKLRQITPAPKNFEEYKKAILPWFREHDKDEMALYQELIDDYRQGCAEMVWRMHHEAVVKRQIDRIRRRKELEL